MVSPYNAEYYGDRLTWAFLRADTASNAKAFRNEGELGIGADFDT